MENLLMEILRAVLVVVVPYIGVIIGKGIKELVCLIKDRKARELAIDVILFIEDKIGSEPGDHKLDAAISMLEKELGYDREKAEEIVRAAYQKIFIKLGKNE